MSRSQFYSIKLFILRHAWLNLWDKHMTTGRINQVTLLSVTISIKSLSRWTKVFSGYNHSHTDSRSCWRVIVDKSQIVRSRPKTLPDSWILSTSHNVFDTKANSLSDQRGPVNELPDTHAWCKLYRYELSSSFLRRAILTNIVLAIVLVLMFTQRVFIQTATTFEHK